MKGNTQGNPSWASERVEAYLDDLLTSGEHQAFEEELEHSLELREEVEAARELQNQLRSLPIQSCPEGVTAQVLQRIQKRESPFSHLRRWLFLSEWVQPRSSLAVLAAACVVILILVFQTNRPIEPPSPRPTPREVRAAEREIEVTLAFLAHVGAKTGAAVQAEVYKSAVVVPIQETVRAISQTGFAASIKSLKNKES